ncbi:MAG: hypothetical protein K2X81_25145, partial [Candidatus Obscuribacterales bacterium]|nr:hypothetical protein [Candidatus Obscuribacterales bacterium]
STASGYVVSGNLLNNTHAQLVQIGNGGTANISVQGNLDLSQASIGELFAYTSGSYAATGTTTLLAPSMTLYVNGGTINTGSVYGGSAAIFISPGLLNVDGNVESGTVTFDGHPVIYTPIAFTEVLPPVINAQKLLCSSIENAVIWQKEHGKLGLAGRDIMLDQADIIVNATKPCRMRSNNCLIEIAKGSVVRVLSNRHETMLQVLNDNHANSVKLTIEGMNAISVGVGEEVLICNSRTAAHEFRSHNKHGIRKTTVYDAAGNTLVRSEFSFVSLAQSCRVLGDLLLANSVPERIVSDRMLRTHASLGMITAKHGPFSLSNR